MSDPSDRPKGQVGVARTQLAVLWVQSQHAVAAYIRSTVRDGHVADDLLQRVAEIATRDFERYDPSRPFTPWLIGIAKMEVMGYFRDKGRSRVHFDNALLERIADTYATDAPCPGPRIEALEVCIGKMQPKSRRLIELRYMRQMPLQQISDYSGLSTHAIRSALHRIRSALAECVTGRLKREGKS